MRRIPLRVYAAVAAIMFLAFATAIIMNPSVEVWLGAGLAAVAITSVMYSYLEWRLPRQEDQEAEEMFE
jgi:hypothetical protein